MSDPQAANLTAARGRLSRRARILIVLTIWAAVFGAGLFAAELYARRAGGFRYWGWPLRTSPFNARDVLKIWNRRFYESRRAEFREWPIPTETFDADGSAPRYLFKP